MNIKRIMAALLALTLLLGGTMSALAESSVVSDLLGFLLGVSADDEATQDESDEVPYEEEEEEADSEIIEGLHVDVEDYAVNEDLPDNWQNILLLGTDSRTSEKNTRTDTMIILSVNTATQEIKLTSLMRDIWVQIPGHGGAKLNAACVYGGPDLTVRCINESFGLNIEDYVLVNMKCLTSIVDSMGGVRIDVSKSEAKAINRLFASDRKTKDANRKFAGENVSAGSQVLLNGKQALAYVRIRSLDDDYARTERQRLMLFTIARQLQQSDLLSLASIITGMLPYVETNMTFDEIMTLAGVCTSADLDAMTELRLPVDGTYQSGVFGGVWCIKPNFEKNNALLYQFIYGE